MNPEEEKSIKKDYLNGMRYKDIFEKYKISISDLKKIIHKYKLTRSKSEVLKGNQNAKNNKGGHGLPNNKNAVVTGEYENIYVDVLTEEEKKLYDSYNISNDDIIDNLLIKEYIDEYKLLTIREKRMLKRIKTLEEKDKDMTIGAIRKKSTSGSSGATETITEAEPTSKTIQRIEDGLTRVQDIKRKSRENMIKLGFSKKTLELKEKQIDNECW